MFLPQDKCVVVKLNEGQYKNISTETGEYDSLNQGTVVDFGQYSELEDKKVLWKAYAEKDAMFDIDGEKYAVIQYEDIRGVE